MSSLSFFNFFPLILIPLKVYTIVTNMEKYQNVEKILKEILL